MLIGMPAGFTSESAGTVRSVKIKAAFPREGVGRAPMRGVEAFAVRRDVTSLEVSAARNAISSYEKLCWTKIDGSKNNRISACGPV